MAERELPYDERVNQAYRAVLGDLENRFEVVTAAGPGVGAVELVDVDVPDLVPVALDDLGVRIFLVDRVVGVEHGLHVRAADLLDQRCSLVERLDHVALLDRQRFDEQRDAGRFQVRYDRAHALDVVSGRLLAGRAAGGLALVRRPKDHDAARRGALRPQIGAQLDEAADVLPALAPHFRVRSGYMQPLGAHRQPVQADEVQPLLGDDVSELGAAVLWKPSCFGLERERSDLDAVPPGALD